MAGGTGSGASGCAIWRRSRRARGSTWPGHAGAGRWRHEPGAVVTVRTAPALLWRAAGEPPAKWPLESASGVCATCGDSLGAGIPVEAIAGETFAMHADYLRYGTHVCPACGWLYSDAKQHHRNVLAVGERLWWPMLGAESATAARPTWAALLREVAATQAPDTVLSGVLTTDPKPRCWPRARLASVGRFGLYVHAPDWDTSQYVGAPLADVLTVSALTAQAVAWGFSKRRCAHGLLADYTRVVTRGAPAWSLERQLRPWRGTPAGLIGMLITPATGGGTDGCAGDADADAGPGGDEGRGPAALLLGDVQHEGRDGAVHGPRAVRRAAGAGRPRRGAGPEPAPVVGDPAPAAPVADPPERDG